MRSYRLLGIFPYFGANSIGGIQFAGRLGWEYLASYVVSQHETTQLFWYSPLGQAALAEPPIILARSKWDAIQKALRGHWQVTTVLVWHIHLLKLVPLMRVKNARIIVVLHGIEAWQRSNWLARVLLQQVDLFISVSDYTWQRFIQANSGFANHRHITVHLGIETPFEGDIPRPDDLPIAVIISRLARAEDYKGHKQLIRAWRHVLTQIPNAELWIAGDGDLRPDLEAMIREHQLEQYIKLLGRVSEEQKTALLSQVRCFLMPSQGEGFGLAYLEAMRLGRPCLVSTCDAGQEVVNPPEAGLAADPDDTPALVDAICRLLTPGSEWDTWSQQARQRYATHFTLAHYQTRLIGAVLEDQP